MLTSNFYKIRKNELLKDIYEASSLDRTKMTENRLEFDEH